MNLRLRRWIALLALLLVPVTGTAAGPLCTSAERDAASAGAAESHSGHGGAHPHHGGQEERTRDDGPPAAPACLLMLAGSGGCLGGYLSVAAPRMDAAAADRPAFPAPVEARPRIAAASLFRPPRA